MRMRSTVPPELPESSNGLSLRPVLQEEQVMIRNATNIDGFARRPITEKSCLVTESS